MVAAGLLGVITTLAVVGYQYYIPKAQASEVAQMMEAQKLVLAKNIQNETCGLGGETTVLGKYGSLEVSGTPIISEGRSCPSGCKFTYTFGDSSNSNLNGKVVDVNVLNNFKLSKTTTTTLAEKYLPSEFGRSETLSGDNCTAITLTNPTITNGTNTGTEIGEVDPTTPTTPNPSTDTGPEDTTTPNSKTETGSTTETSSTTETNCVKYQAQAICSDMGTYSCDVYNGNRRNGVSFYLQGEANNRNLLPRAALKMFSFIMRNGRCPATRDENYSTAVMGVGMSCHTVDISKLQLNTSCPAVD